VTGWPWLQDAILHCRRTWGACVRAAGLIILRSTVQVRDALPLTYRISMSIEELTAQTNALGRQIKLYYRLQLTLTALCWAALIFAIGIKFFGVSPKLVFPLACIAAVCGFGSWLTGRTLLRPLFPRMEEARHRLGKWLATGVDTAVAGGLPKIPLTIGFANLAGSEFDAIAEEDAGVLSPLFLRAKVVPHHQIPASEILFVYAHLNEDGTINGQSSSGIRQIVQMTNTAILVVASPNSPESVKNAASLAGPKTANIVFTLDRNGHGFAQFFNALFGKMRDGKEMLGAWVELAPQSPAANQLYAPQTILLAEGGKIAFPRV
jgi:hypothetical protein